MRGSARGRLGITLVEVLVSMAIFGIVMAIAYAAINGSLRIQADQEAVTTTQGKLRRVMEVMTQDLRSSVFGSITNQPYESSDTQVSFMMLTGGAGYSVLAPPTAHGFPSSNEIRVQMPDARPLRGQEIVMINADEGLGVVLPVNQVNSDGPGVWRIGSSCRNTIPYSLNSMLVFEVETVGMRFDEEEQSIMTTVSGSDEAPFAFDVSDFRVEYVYTSPGADMRVETQPVTGDKNVPIRSFSDGGDNYTLERIQLVVGANAESRGNSREHAYTGQVDLSRTTHFEVEEIVPCN